MVMTSSFLLVSLVDAFSSGCVSSCFRQCIALKNQKVLIYETIWLGVTSGVGMPGCVYVVVLLRGGWYIY